MTTNLVSRFIRSLVAITGIFWNFSVIQAASIGVDFNDPNVAALLLTDAAGVYPFTQAYFNTVTSPSSSALFDDSGTLTLATVTTSGAVFGVFDSLSIPRNTPNRLLNAGFAGNTNNFSFTIGNIPYTNYLLIVYDLARGEGIIQGITVGTTTRYTSCPNLSDLYQGPLPYQYFASYASTPQAASLSTNYVQFTLSGPSQTVIVSNYNDVFRMVGGFQIIELPGAPEPTSGVLFVGIAVAMLALRRPRVSASPLSVRAHCQTPFGNA